MAIAFYFIVFATRKLKLIVLLQKILRLQVFLDTDRQWILSLNEYSFVNSLVEKIDKIKTNPSGL